ncbi:MAG: AAA family ATPase, partial [Eubacterium sp.]|nr:AAA family ATPase [Eubacterium sp.]
MYITINGQLGSGKSEICKFFKREHGFDVFSTGRIQRERAKQQGISTLEMNEKSGKDYSLDYIIDNATVEFAKENQGKDVI